MDIMLLVTLPDCKGKLGPGKVSLAWKRAILQQVDIMVLVTLFDGKENLACRKRARLVKGRFSNRWTSWFWSLCLTERKIWPAKGELGL